VCERWIYSACLCFALSLEEQQQTNFRYQFSVYQTEYSHNLLFSSGAQMQRVFGQLLDRTRARLDVPTVRTIFGARHRPHCNRTSTSRVEAMVETPRYDLTVFKVHFGNLTLKAYTKGAHVLRFEAIVHNTKELGCGRVLARFSEIVARLTSMLERFLATLDCLDAAFIADQTLEQLPLPSQVGTTRIGGIDLNQPRIRAALAAVLALAPAPGGFTVAQLAAKVQAMTGQDYTTRQAAYDLKKLRGKHLVVKPGRSRRYHAPPDALRTITALLVLRDQVIAPILAGVRVPRRGRKPTTWTRTDQHYETLRMEMKALFSDLGIAA
jgi:hypothetical protein